MSESLFIELNGSTGSVTLNNDITLSNQSMVLAQVAINLTQPSSGDNISELIVRSPIFGGSHIQVIANTSNAGALTPNHAVNGLTLPIDPSGANGVRYWVARNPHKTVPFGHYIPQSFPISVTTPDGLPIGHAVSSPDAVLHYVMLWFNYDSL